MQYNSMFESISVNRLFLKFAVPGMISMFFTSIYIVFDGIFVSCFVGADAMASVNIAMPIVIISFALADMIAVGASVQISIKLGENNEMEANNIFTICN